MYVINIFVYYTHQIPVPVFISEEHNLDRDRNLFLLILWPSTWNREPMYVFFEKTLKDINKTFIVNISCTSPITFSNGKFNFDTRKRDQFKMTVERDQLLCWPTITGYQCSMSRHTWSNFYNWCYIICV